MYQISVNIKTLTPVVFSEKSGDTVLTATKDYFTGSAIRGALAQKYIRGKAIDCPIEDAEFCDLFLSGKISFLPAYISEKINETNCVAEPLPSTLVLSKMKNEKKEKEFKDMLALKEGEKVGAGFKPLKGFGVVVPADVNDKSKGNLVYGTSVNKAIELHMSRSSEDERRMGRSDDGGIYNYEALQAGQNFTGYLEGSEEDLQKLLTALKNAGFNQKGYVYFGRSKNTQYGKCYIELGEVVEKKVVQVYANKSLFVYFLTDFIPAKNAFLEVKEALSDLTNMLNTVAPLEIGRIFATNGTVESFVGPWGAKRARLRAINAGAIVELTKADGTEWSKTEADQVAEILANKPAGKLTVEGYGQMKLWQPQAIKLAELAQAAPVKPESYPEEVIKVASIIIDKYIYEQLQLMAANDLKKCTKAAGKNHFFGRLEDIISSCGSVAEAKNKLNPDAEENNAEVKLRSAFAKTLEEIKISGLSLGKCLCGESGYDNSLLPYAGKLKDLLNEDLAALAKEIGYKLPKDDDIHVYKIYWMWFCRLARKAKKGGK